MRLLRLAFCLQLLLVPGATCDTEQRLASFADYARSVLREWGEPGMAIAIVQHDRVVYARGFGVRQKDGTKPVDEHTVFGIGSLTKAFTVAALGLLVDEGRLRWDDHVIDYLPYLQLYDTYATRELTIRDLLCHRSGLPAYGGDLLSFHTTYTRRDILQRLRYLRPASSFRSRYAYQNNLFVAAGEVIPAVTGTSWDEFVQTRLFAPLGMKDSSTSVTGISALANVATPHALIANEPRPVTWSSLDNLGPAGSINSSVADIAQWLRVQLHAGVYGERRVWSEAVAREMHTPQTPMPLPPARGSVPMPRFAAYGLGWQISEYHGHTLLAHNGGVLGMTARIVLSPADDLGVVILTNGERGLATPLLYRVLDALLDLPEHDYAAESLARSRAAVQQEQRRWTDRERARAKSSRPSLALSEYAGEYRSPALGAALLRMTGQTVELRLKPYPQLTGIATHWQYDTFLVRWNEPTWPRTFLSFSLDENGRATAFRLRLAEEADPSFDFENYQFARATPVPP